MEQTTGTFEANSRPSKDAAVDGDVVRESNVNDLVIRDGFPALLLSGGQRPNVDDFEPLPRHPVWACESALTFLDCDKLIADCETVFTARLRDAREAYSAGTTYFFPCQMKPRCALEALVLDIFHIHTAAMDPTTFSPPQSGAEWWTLILDDDDDETDKATPTTTVECKKAKGRPNDDDNDDDEEEEDEVGWHFDADYGLEAQAPNLLLHPRLATVTYLTDYGAPTVILNVKSPAPSDTKKSSLEGSVDKAWISSPKIGKHLAFDGRLLHGAPATFFPAATKSISVTGVEPLPKKIKLDSASSATQSRKRVTLLVNIWLNHCPLDAEPLEESVVDDLQCEWPSNTNITSHSSSNVRPDGSISGEYFTWNHEKIKLDMLPDISKLSITNVCDENPAGEDKLVLCERLVTINYCAAMEDLHMAAMVASSATNFLDVTLGHGVLSIHVGDQCQTESDDEDDEEGCE